MLVWEEEVRTLPKTVAPVVEPALHRSAAPSSPSLSPAPASAADAAAAAASHHRVVAADKRIINGKTDVNQLVLFKYK